MRFLFYPKQKLNIEKSFISTLILTHLDDNIALSLLVQREIAALRVRTRAFTPRLGKFTSDIWNLRN